MSWMAVFDLDTIVVDDAGAVSDRDRSALAKAAGSGAHLAFATSRRAPSAGSFTRSLALDGWVIACDGAQIGRSRDGRIVTRHTLPATVAGRCAEILWMHALRVVAVTLEAIHGDADDEPLAREVLGPLADVYAAAWPRLNDLCAIVAIGDAASVTGAHRQISALAPTRLSATRFSVGGRHALRVSPLRSSRARAIADVAARLGIRRTQVVYAGGLGHPCGDSGVLLATSRVFCPRSVPPDVAPHAARLESERGRGAIAESLERWLAAQATTRGAHDLGARRPAAPGDRSRTDSPWRDRGTP